MNNCITINVPEITIELDNIIVNPVIGDAEPYEGEYSVLPLPEQQTLSTAKKYCVEDITIKSIPFYEVTNDSGGTTVVIDKIKP